MGGRDWLVAAMLALLALETCGAIALGLCTVPIEPAGPVTFNQEPRDRPVLETPRQVWEARATGVSTFRFDGVLYVVEGLPRHYVDYSSWYVRMP